MALNEAYTGEFGGKYIPEIFYETFENLILGYKKAKSDPAFWNEYVSLLGSYSCRPTPVTFAENLTNHLGGAKILIKREDLNHTGAHKLNNVIGQGLLTRLMGKKRVIAETGAGQHGVATATMAAKFGFDCTIYMGAKDVERQYPNVFWMEKLGAKVIPVESGSRTLKDAIDEAMRDWSENFQETHYVLGTACGAYPFPEMVTWFQSIIGKELKQQMLTRYNTLPRAIYACVGGGSNALGVMHDFLNDTGVDLIGVEAGGLGLDTNKHAARIASGKAVPGICQGYRTYFLQDNEGQMAETHSISAGLDYVGVSPIISHYWKTGRIRVEAATDNEVIEAVKLTIRKEGIIPALESSHAFAQAIKEAGKYSKDDYIVINQSGRGDKDIFTIADAFGDESWKNFLKRKVAGLK
jgi:tryptophan synthase beta chain